MDTITLQAKLKLIFRHVLLHMHNITTLKYIVLCS